MTICPGGMLMTNRRKRRKRARSMEKFERQIYKETDSEEDLEFSVGHAKKHVHTKKMFEQL